MRKPLNTETAEKLYEAFYMKVFSYVMTLAGNQDEAMEITQETFFGQFPQIRPSEVIAIATHGYVP